jgi:hypothetical protein
MLKTSTILMAIATISVCGRSLPAQENKEDQSPPQIFYLEVGGKKVPIKLNEPFATNTLTANPTATLRVEPYRVFRYAGIRFAYPQDYSFSASLDDPEVSIWTLTGSNSLIMVQRYPNQPNPQAFLQQVLAAMKAQYAGGVLKETEATLAVKGAPLKGVAIDVTMAGSHLRQELFSLPSEKDAIILLLQDVPQDNGQPSPKRVEMGKMLAGSFKLPEKD